MMFTTCATALGPPRSTAVRGTPRRSRKSISILERSSSERACRQRRMYSFHKSVAVSSSWMFSRKTRSSMLRGPVGPVTPLTLSPHLRRRGTTTSEVSSDMTNASIQDIDPTLDGQERVKQALEQSIQRHEQDLERAYDLLEGKGPAGAAGLPENEELVDAALQLFI